MTINIDMTIDEPSELDMAVTQDVDNVSFELGAEAIAVKNHAVLENRDRADQHPISAITGLANILSTIPTKTSQLSNDSGYVTASDIPTVPTKTSQLQNDSGYITSSAIPTVPTKTSQLTNDSGFLTSYTETDPTVPSWAKASTKPTYTASEVGALPNTTVIPTKTSDLTNDSGYITSVPVTSVNSKTGAVVLTASEVGALPDDTFIPTKTSDLINDSDFMSGMTILLYGHSTWQDFITAYTKKHVVYCRASSQSNPATGSQTRLAFMAYVNNADSPTEVEFQYYRSVSTHTTSQQGDQVYVYKLTSAGTWTVTVREASVKVAAGTGITGTYSGGTMTLALDGTLPTKTSDLTNDSGYITLADLPIYDGTVN